MKILIVNDDFPPISYTGPSIVALNLARGMQKLGHEIFVITSVQKKESAGEENFLGIKIYRIYSQYPRRWSSYLILYNPQIISEFKRIIRDIKPDVCHFHNLHQYMSFYCLAVAARHCKRLFFTAHDMMIISYDKWLPHNGDCFYKISWRDHWTAAKKRYNPLRNFAIRRQLGKLQKIFAISEAQKKIFNINGIQNVEVIYNSINADEWQVQPQLVEQFKNSRGLTGKKVILFGGRLSQAKGALAVVEAMSMVVKEIPEAVLLVAAENNEKASDMVKFIKQKNLTDRVIFTGWLDRDQMKVAFHTANVVVTPSIYFDPFNLFNIELIYK